MTDNTILPGTGETYASKDRAGVKFQQVLTDSPRTVYGEGLVAQKVRQVSLKYSYGTIPPDSGQALTNKSGSTVTVANAQAIITCAAVAEAFSQIRTKEYLRYDPGIGSEMTGSCTFAPGTANSSQVFGAGDDDEGLFFGYDGTEFGVLLRARGSLEIKTITITSAASGSGSITIELDGTSVAIAVVSGDTIAEVCEKITAETAAFGNAGRGWEVVNKDDNTLHFLSLVAENATGAFSFTDTGGTGVTAGSLTEVVPGVAPEDTWIPKTTWNIDKLDGTGVSGMILNPAKGNVYAIEFQYHGYGSMIFSVEDPETGALQRVHMIKYANANTVPMFDNPTLSITVIVKTEIGYTGSALVLNTASTAGFIQGVEAQFGVRSSISQAKTMGTTEQALLVLANALVFNGIRNKITTQLTHVSYSTESGKPVELRLYKDVLRVDGGAALVDVATNQSVIASGQVGTTIGGGTRLITMSIGANGAGQRDLKNSNLLVKPGERWVVTAKLASGADAIVSVSFTMIEEE